MRETGSATAPRSGLTLIEVLIVCVLIAILVAVAVPLLSRSRTAANEVSAIKSLRLIHQAQIQHRLTYSVYGTLHELGTSGRGLITDVALTAGVRNGYRFDAVIDTPATWHAIAAPVVYATDGYTTYFVDESGLIRGSDLGGGPPPGRGATSQWRPVE